LADKPSETAVNLLAETYTDSGGDIKAMLRTLIASPEFALSARGKLKRPLEFFISLLIHTQAEIKLDQRSLRALTQPLRSLGQVPHMWPSPDGYPDTSDWWTTSSGMLTRWNFAMRITRGEMRGVRVPLPDITADGQSPQDIVDLLSLQFLGERLPDPARDVLVSYAADGDLGKNLPGVAGVILASPYFQVR